MHVLKLKWCSNFYSTAYFQFLWLTSKLLWLKMTKLSKMLMLKSCQRHFTEIDSLNWELCDTLIKRIQRTFLNTNFIHFIFTWTNMAHKKSSENQVSNTDAMNSDDESGCYTKNEKVKLFYNLSNSCMIFFQHSFSILSIVFWCRCSSFKNAWSMQINYMRSIHNPWTVKPNRAHGPKSQMNWRAREFRFLMSRN